MALRAARRLHHVERCTGPSSALHCCPAASTRYRYREDGHPYTAHEGVTAEVSAAGRLLPAPPTAAVPAPLGPSRPLPAQPL